ncbi:MAG: arsenic transporter [Nocardiopsaceae bacterium]|nr:arsenic transporter [Nocardiopsaceae bacterium]
MAFFATGLLPAHDAGRTWHRIWPLALFLAMVVVLAELTTTAGFFDLVARRLAIIARGNFAALFALCVAFAAATTIGLNLDTTAVLLTPVMLALARALRVPPLPIAICTVWLANTASLLLPVSNLTNLLARDRVTLTSTAFAARMGAAQVASLLVTGVALWAFYWRRGRRGADRYPLPEPFRPDDPWLTRIAGTACLFFIIAAILANQPLALAIAASIAAGAVLAAFAVRDRGKLRWSLVPWRLPVFLTGLFFVMQTISLHLLGPVMHALIGSSPGPGGTFRAAATGAGLANLVNNLPAYVAGEAAVPMANHTQLLGLLIGVNVGPVITPWASLATLIWFDRCASAGVRIPLRRFMLTGACVAVAGIALATAALLWA